MMTDQETEFKQVTLLDGTVIEDAGYLDFPPAMHIKTKSGIDLSEESACIICPIRELCGDNNEFDCSVYGMFKGFYFGIREAFEYTRDNGLND